MSTTVRVRNNIPLLQKQLSDDRSSIQAAADHLEQKINEKINSNIPPPLSPKTIAKKKSSLALVDTGELRGQITTRQLGNKEQSIDVGIFGSRAAIASVHEFGAPSKSIPERSFLRSTASENKQTIAEVFGAQMKVVVEKAVLK